MLHYDKHEQHNCHQKQARGLGRVNRMAVLMMVVGRRLRQNWGLHAIIVALCSSGGTDNVEMKDLVSNSVVQCMIFKRQLEHCQFHAEAAALSFFCCNLDFGPVGSADRFYD
jgi:hypothetical protein